MMESTSDVNSDLSRFCACLPELTDQSVGEFANARFKGEGVAFSRLLRHQQFALKLL